MSAEHLWEVGLEAMMAERQVRIGCHDGKTFVGILKHVNDLYVELIVRGSTLGFPLSDVRSAVLA